MDTATILELVASCNTNVMSITYRIINKTAWLYSNLGVSAVLWTVVTVFDSIVFTAWLQTGEIHAWGFDVSPPTIRCRIQQTSRLIPTHKAKAPPAPPRLSGLRMQVVNPPHGLVVGNVSEVLLSR